MTPQALLAQLGVHETPSSLQACERAIQNTKGFEIFARHIVSLNDFLKHTSGFVGLSNSNDFFKIKCSENASSEILDEFHKKVQDWAKKYKINLQKIADKDVYYILGKDEEN